MPKNNMEDTTKTIAKVEHLGIFPIILKILNGIGLIEHIDTIYGRHGNWKGASKGVVTAVWICYIISRCDHRLSPVAKWVSERELSLNACLSKWGYSISTKDFTDDRLILLLEDFSDLERWTDLESEVNKSFISVHDLQGRTIQLDPTIGKSFKSAVKDGLFQYGSSKHFRKDLPQFKTILANLCECNFPLGAITVSGNQADDVLYIPMIKQTKKSLPEAGLMWQGDCKLSALGNRAYIAGINDYYLCPLSGVQVPAETLYKDYVCPVLEGKHELAEVIKDEVLIAEGYELSVEQEYEGLKWEERQLVIRSVAYAKSQSKSLDKRILKAADALFALNDRKQGKTVYKTEDELRQAGHQILAKHGVEGLLEVEYRVNYEEKHIRAYKDKPARTVTKMSYVVLVKKNEAAIEQHKQRLGWRVYVTNQPKDKLSLQQAVLAYRQEYKIERRIRNLKQEVTALLPLYLKKDQRIEALINLLVLVLKVIAAVEFDIARALKDKAEKLEGLYAGNPTISTATPTISKIVEAFENLYVVFIYSQNQLVQVVPPQLNKLQRKIIQLLGLSEDLYLKIEPVSNIVESG